MRLQSKEKIRERIAKRVALEMNDGMVINLGIGLPSLVANYVDKQLHVILQSENGLLGIGNKLDSETPGHAIVDAGGQNITAIKGSSFFNSADSFAIIRGGHVDATVLGALQVDELGNLASWIVPGKMVAGMGGAMDLVVGAKKVIIAMEHTAKGETKILSKCTLPLTAVNQVDMIVTELSVFEFINRELYLIEIAPDISLEELKILTPATYKVSEDLKVMDV